MIDQLSAFSKKVIWLRPLSFISIAAAILVFGYVVLFAEGVEKDVYIIPSLVVVLWSLGCSLVLSFFPYVPPKPDRQMRLFARLKVRLARGGYHLGAWVFCVMSAALVWLTIRLVGVWLAEF